MKPLLQRIKRGDSTVLGYVLLIVFAIGMAAAVFSYLKFFLPKEQPQCPEGVSLAISNMSCSGTQFSITLQNKGLFSVNGTYVKIGEKGRVFKQLINCPGPQQHAPYCQLYFNMPNSPYLPQVLRPGEKWSGSFNYTQGTGEREVEVEPFLIINQGLQEVNRSRILCSNAVITSTVRCT